MTSLYRLRTLLLQWALLLATFVQGVDCGDYESLPSSLAEDPWFTHPHQHVATVDNIHKNFVSATLGSNMVLQRDQTAILWGWDSEPGTTVTATLKQMTDDAKLKHTSTIIASVETKVADDGLWRMKVPPQQASLTPIWIDIQSTSGKTARLENILFGDVYLCGGQSNMVFSLPATTNGTEEAHRANDYPHIRIFTVGQGTSSDTPLPDLQTVRQTWSVANETSIYLKNGHSMFTYFSSVCWFFGREIADGLDNQIPVGLISNNWGGTKVQQWQPEGKLYNAMIHPYMVGPMALTGFSWYQGESNANSQEEADKYSDQFPNMIQSWRKGFALPEAYFGFVQLSASCQPPFLAQVREAQMKALTSVPGKIAYATNVDRGDGCNIHPPAKQYCGARLGRSALAVQYGQSSIHWKSPSYSHIVQSNSGQNGDASIRVVLQDVSPQGLYLIDVPFTIDPNRPSREHPKTQCKDLEPGTCVGAQVLLNDESGWTSATISITGTNEVTLTAKTVARDPAIVATSYGFGLIPLMTIYDKGTNLPVLPWKAQKKTTFDEFEETVEQRSPAN